MMVFILNLILRLNWTILSMVASPSRVGQEAIRINLVKTLIIPPDCEEGGRFTNPLGDHHQPGIYSNDADPLEVVLSHHPPQGPGTRVRT